MLTAEDLDNFRRQLEEERKAIESRLAARNQDIAETVEKEEGVGDDVDEGVRIYDREDDEVSNEIDQRTLEQVNRALDRIKEGTYGISEVSGKPIPRERLEAVPYATTLVDEEPPDTE